jgi:hypothetical protein
VNGLVGAAGHCLNHDFQQLQTAKGMTQQSVGCLPSSHTGSCKAGAAGTSTHLSVEHARPAVCDKLPGQAGSVCPDKCSDHRTSSGLYLICCLSAEKVFSKVFSGVSPAIMRSSCSRDEHAGCTRADLQPHAVLCAKRAPASAHLLLIARAGGGSSAAARLAQLYVSNQLLALSYSTDPAGSL